MGALTDWIRGVVDPKSQLLPASQFIETSWAIDYVYSMDATEMWRTQPSVRAVVGFIARNIARLGIHTFIRTGDERERTRTDPVARLLAAPNPDQTTYELFHALISDWALNDDAYLLTLPDTSRPSGWIMRAIPSKWVLVTRATAWAVLEYSITVPGKRPQLVPAEFVLRFHGWNPEDTRNGVSRLIALKDTMAEQISAAKYRKQVWDTGNRASAVITRPAQPNGGTWSDEARTRFIDHLRAAFARDGESAGGTLVLEDGMTMNKIGFSAQEEQFVEAAKLSLETAAMVWYINPTMIGMLDNANYSNMREFRKALYGETLGAEIEMIQDRINTFLVPKVTKADVFTEFNVKAQLRGSFEEEAAVLSTSAGAPWLTRNEVRGMQNRPPIEGGDELIVPLNVLVGGQASPQDSAAGQFSAGPVSVQAIEQIVRSVVGGKSAGKARPGVKVHATKAESAELADTLTKFFRRQREVVVARLGAKADGWWDEERWNSELADDLYQLALTLSEKVGKETLALVGLDPSEYDVDQTLHYLEALAGNTSGRINSVTKQQIDDALASDGGVEAVANVFDVAESARAPEASTSIAAGIAGFAAVESLRQTGHEESTKTWVVTSANPRPTHAMMSGETVPLSENFSNGGAWPGDSVNLSVDEVAGCDCELVMNIP